MSYELVLFDYHLDIIETYMLYTFLLPPNNNI